MIWQRILIMMTLMHYLRFLYISQTVFVLAGILQAQINAYGGISYPVTKGSTYYLYFEIQSDFTGTGKYISGWGKISPVTPK